MKKFFLHQPVTFETVPYEKLLPPIHRKFFPQEQADMLHTIKLYQKLYPLANFRPVSFAYLQSTRAVIANQVLTSATSRTLSGAVVVAYWPNHFQQITFGLPHQVWR